MTFISTLESLTATGSATMTNKTLSSSTNTFGRNILQSTPANPVGTASATPVQMGLAVAFTPSLSPTTNCAIKISCQLRISSDTINDGGAVQLSFGTGTAPTNGAAAAGTTSGTIASSNSFAANELQTITLISYIGGLTNGTAYWVDLQLRALTGGTASIQTINMLIEEVHA